MAKTLSTGLVNCSIRMVSTKDNIAQLTVSTKTMGTMGTVSECTSFILREDCPGLLRRGPSLV